MFSFRHIPHLFGVPGHKIGKGRGKGVFKINIGEIQANMYVTTTGGKAQDGRHVKNGGSENAPRENEGVDGGRPESHKGKKDVKVVGDFDGRHLDRIIDSPGFPCFTFCVGHALGPLGVAGRGQRPPSKTFVCSPTVHQNSITGMPVKPECLLKV